MGIRAQESGGEPEPYKAINPKSDGGNGAYGAYQFIGPTWRAYGFDTLYGVPRADMAKDFQQDDAARIALNTLYADDDVEHDWERVIAAWFYGPGPFYGADGKGWHGQGGPKSNWTLRDPDRPYNPTIREYVDGVLAHIKEIT